MRGGLIVGGVVFLVMGLAWFAIPLSQYVTTGYATESAPLVFYEPQFTPAQLTFAVNWFSVSAITVSVYSCGSDTSCSGGSQYETSANLVGEQSSADGSISFTGTAGTGYEAYATGSSSLLDVNYTGPLLGGFFGLAFLIFAVLLIIPGVVLKPSAREKARKAARAAARGGAAPAPVNYLAGAPPPGAQPPPPPGGIASSGAGLAGLSGGPTYPGAPVDPSNPYTKK